jgi:hypothetical protein
MTRWTGTLIISEFGLCANWGIAHLNHNADSDGPFTLSESGVYRLVIERWRPSATISSGSSIWPQPFIALDEILAGTLDPGLLSLIHRLAGVVGQRLYFDGLGVNNSARWRLLNPRNELIFDTTLTGDAEVTVNQTGTHVLVFDGDGTEPVPYSIRILTPNDDAGSPPVRPRSAISRIKPFGGHEHRSNSIYRRRHRDQR